MSTTNETKGFYKLSWLQRIGYGSGDLAQNLIFQTVACYLMLYLTTVLKINPAFVSGLILTVRLIDCFWSPVVGRYIDNRNPKMGKYRTYLLYGGIPLTVAACLLMLPQAATWSSSMKLIYATVSYTVLSMIYSVVNIPYGSIMASMTRDNDEVLKLTSTRMVCANIWSCYGSSHHDRLEPGSVHGHWYYSCLCHPAFSANVEEMVGQEGPVLHAARYWFYRLCHPVHYW